MNMIHLITYQGSLHYQLNENQCILIGKSHKTTIDLHLFPPIWLIQWPHSHLPSILEGLVEPESHFRHETVASFFSGQFQVLIFFHIPKPATAESCCCLKIPTKKFRKPYSLPECHECHKTPSSYKHANINLGTSPCFHGQGSTPNHIGMVQLLGNLDLTLKPQRKGKMETQGWLYI